MTKSFFKTLLVSMANSRLGSGLMSSMRNRFVPIFMLHRMQDDELGVSGHPPEVLKQSLEYLKAHGYSVISIDHLIKGLNGEQEIPDKSVVFTMDDGFYDQIAIAAPIFKAFDDPFSIFLLADFSSGDVWPWDYKLEYIFHSTTKTSFDGELGETNYSLTWSNQQEKKSIKRYLGNQLKNKTTIEAELAIGKVAQILDVEVDEKPPLRYRPITWEDARQHEGELIQFGPHSMSHSILASQNETVCREEIINSWERVKNELANPLDVFCYPTGRLGVDFGAREMDIVNQLGLRAGLSVTPGFVNMREHGGTQHRYCLPRFGFPNDIQDFIQLCSWVELAKEKIRNNI